MVFNKSEMEKLIQQGTKDEQRLAALQQKFRALEPRWSELQAACEYLEALANSQSGTFNREVAAVFWAARSAKLTTALDVAIRERDNLTKDICAEIAAVKQRVFLRATTVAGNFGSWAYAVSAKLPGDSPLVAELLAARKKCDESTDIAEIVETTTHWAGVIEATESMDLPLFRLMDTVQQALAAA